MPYTILPFAITSAFASVFVYSAWHEFARRRREGRLENPRDAFEFDKTAPTFEDPTATDTDATDTPDTPATMADLDAAAPESIDIPDNPDTPDVHARDADGAEPPHALERKEP